MKKNIMKVIVFIVAFIVIAIMGVGFVSEEKVSIKEENVIFVNGSNISRDYVIDINEFEDNGDSIEYVIMDHETGGLIVQIDKEAIPSNAEYVCVVAK